MPSPLKKQFLTAYRAHKNEGVNHVRESKILLSEIEGEFLHQRKNGDLRKYAGWTAVFQPASEDVPDVPQIQRYPHAE